MTMTFDCTEEFKNDYKAACHIDGTARPQILFKDDCDNFVYGLLEMYEQKTGKKALINTSFNLHNYPIIESAKVAIESWKESNTDMLIINNFVIEKE
jgi:carbamoyltransferase